MNKVLKVGLQVLKTIIHAVIAVVAIITCGCILFFQFVGVLLYAYVQRIVEDYTEAKDGQKDESVSKQNSETNKEPVKNDGGQ